MVKKVRENEIVDALIELIDEVEPDPEGGVRGGDQVTWTPDWDESVAPTP